LPGKIIGIEDIHEREITKELLSSKRHFETIFLPPNKPASKDLSSAIEKN